MDARMTDNLRNNDHNPWLRIPAADYEDHMNLPRVDQLAPLSAIFSEIYCRFKPASLVVLGCATGNGFEHIDPDRTRRIIGVDINPEYLDILRRRFSILAPSLELIREPIETCAFEDASIDLVHAGLIFEYLNPEPLIEKIAGWLAPKGVFSAVLQLPSASSGSVTDTHIASVKILENVIELVPPKQLERIALDNGLISIESKTIALPGGKSFFTGIYQAQ
jgi:SAM-dependent methyltransferase